MPLVSVVIPTYNRSRYIAAAVESALAQSHRETEVIVVDDSSTDGTADIIKAFGDKVKYIRQDNLERGAARNNGIRNSGGEYVAFLDSDDAWLPDHLRECLAACEASGCGVAYSGSFIVDESGGIIGKLPASPFGKDPLRELVSGYSSRGCNASSCVVKRELFGKAGNFSEKRELSGSEDWEMWARLASVSGMAYTGKYTAMVRFHAGKSSINPGRMAASMKMALETVFANKDLLPGISDLEKRARARLYTVTAVNYYAAGEMAQARGYLSAALRSSPAALLRDPLIIYTFLRSLLGAGISSAARKAKWALAKRK